MSRWPTILHFRYFLIACLSLVGEGRDLRAEQKIFQPLDIWNSWTYPAGALTMEGNRLEMVRSRKNIDAAQKATIRGAGTNLAAAASIIDGDPQTGWSPDAAAPVGDWWIEIDLQQVLPAQQIRLYFDEQHAPLSFFTVSLSNGERFINNANIPVEGTLVFNSSERFSLNEEHAISIDLEDALVQVVRIEITRSQESVFALNEIEISAFGDNIALNLIEKGGAGDAEAAILTVAGTPSVMFDGDLVSFWRVSPLAKGSSGGSATFGDYRIDLGAVYWIDSIWILGAPIGLPFRLRNLYGNFLSYRILHSDGSLAPDGTLAWKELVSVPSDPKNLLETRDFQHRFPPVAARYLRLYYPTSTGGNIIGGGDWGDTGLTRLLYGLGLIGEFQIFGEGHPARVVLRSPVVDLGEEWNITSVEWRATVPSGAGLLLRSRSGDEVEEETRYFDKNGKEVTQRRWDKLIGSFRGPVETTLSPGDDWSPWSEAYRTSGTFFRSPSPRRYFQLEAEFLSDVPGAGVALDELTIDFSRPLARRAVGEIQPGQVEPGVETEFSYFLRPDLGTGSQGFERIALEASVPLRFRQVLINGHSTPGAESEPNPDGFRLIFPARLDDAALVEIRFAATVFQNGTRFRAFLEQGSGSARVRQQVDPGDAVREMAGATDVVVLPINDELLSHLDLGSRIFTPNGDGLNDELKISFDVLKLLEHRPLDAWVFDLRGRVVRHLNNGSGLAGHYELRWDGRDDRGALVAPGLYLFRLRVDGDSSTRTVTSTLGVSY